MDYGFTTIHALRNIFRNRRRSMVTILIAMVGTASLMVFQGYNKFVYDTLKEISARDTGNVIIAHAQYFDEDEEVPMDFGLQGADDLVKLSKQHPAVQYALTSVAISGLISNGDKSLIYNGWGVEVAEFEAKGPFLTFVSGEPLSPYDPEGDLEILIGAPLAKSLDASVGDWLTLINTTVDGNLNAVDVKLRGVVDTGVPQVDRFLVFTHIKTAQPLLLTDKVSRLSLFLDSIESTPEVESWITQQTLTNDAGELRLIGEQLAVKNWLDLAVFYKKVRGVYDGIFGTIGVIVLVLVFFSVSNTMATSITERTKEIGTMAALGTTEREILTNFVLEGFFIGLIGAAVGFVAATGIATYLDFFEVLLPPPPGRSQPYPLKVYLDIKIVSSDILLVSLSCLTASWFAARKAVKQPIIQALGHV